MLLTRPQLEVREHHILASYAVKSAESRGREYAEEEGDYRTCFQRDRDRIINSKAFRRLRGKTQVFIAGYGDHYRTRLTHSLEVAYLSRDIARLLNLNEDLAESIALAHDLGHTPFAHAGQDEMHAIMKQFGARFEHNEQSRRVVDVFEEKSPYYPGLNLSFEVRDGLLKHRTHFDHPEPEDTLMPSLEAQIVNIADEIAYQNHDIDDGLRSGIIQAQDFEVLEIWQRAKLTVDSTLPFDFWIMAMISSLVSLMVNDLGAYTNRMIQDHSIRHVNDIYGIAEPLSDFSPEVRQMANALKKFLYKNFYQSDGVMEYNTRGQKVIRTLFEYFLRNSSFLPDKIRQRIGVENDFIVIKDYIAGMTDKFALDLYAKLEG
jgi:dGTPase